MTRVTFETASFADSVSKAARVAPTKGAALNKSPGVVLVIDPNSEHPVTLKATDTLVWYMELLEPLESAGEPTAWWLPSMILSSFIGSLPIGSDQTVTLEDQEGRILIQSGKIKARLNKLNPDNYPQWDSFNPDMLTTISGLGDRMQRVSWAASRGGDDPFTGIHLDGKLCVATDKYRFAVLPMEVDLPEPVTIPFSALAELFKSKADTKIGMLGSQIVFMPDETTQIRASIFSQPYPNVQVFVGRSRDQTNHLTISRTMLKDCIARVANIVRADRTPRLQLTIGNGIIWLYMKDHSAGDIEETLDIAGQAEHDYMNILVTPKNLMDALESCPGDEVTIGYNAGNPMKVLHIAGGMDYEVWIVPRKNQEDKPA